MRTTRFSAIGGLLLAALAQAKDDSSSPVATVTSSLVSTPLPGVTKAPTLVSGCAAAVSTTSICSTCLTAACIYEETMTVSCGCPSPAVTIFASHPCELGCDNLTGCGTITKVVVESCTRDGTGHGTLTKPGPDVDTTVTTPGPTGTSGSGAPTTAGTSVGTVVTNGAGHLVPFRFW